MNPEDSARNGSVYAFLDFTLDLSTERLLRGDAEIKLRPKSFQVLRFLVEHPCRLVGREELLQAVWGDVAVTDESVTKCIADVRRALKDDSQEIIRTMHGRGFLFQADVRNLNTLQQPTETPTLSKPPFARRRLALVAAASVAVLAVGVILIRWYAPVLERNSAFEAIAVLPFESLSAGEDQQYLADGMTEALITGLGEVSPLRVIARTSVVQYEKTRKPVRDIALELNVDVIVEGTVTQSGDRIRVTANLIQVSPEKHIWAHSFERDLRNVIALQNEISSAIADEIHGKLTPAKRRLPSDRPVNPEAQLAYWKARYLLANRKDTEAANQGIEYAEQALRIAPDYAPAHVALALSYANLNGGENIPIDAASRSKAAALKAIALDDQLADAHVALGVVYMAFDWNWAGAEREFRRAVSLNPSSAGAHGWLGNYFAAVGRTDEAVDEIKKARQLDPSSFAVNWNVGRMLCLARRYDEAIFELGQVAGMQRNSSPVDIWLFKSLLERDRTDEAVAVDLRMREYRDGLQPESLQALRAAYSEKGLPGYWTKLRELLLPKFQNTANGVYRLAEISASMNDREAAFHWLDKAYESRTGWMPFIKVDPSLDPLRSDPRFTALLDRMGLTP